MPAIKTTHLQSPLNDPMMTFLPHGSLFDQKPRTVREFANSVQPANLTLQLGCLHGQNNGHGKILSDQDLSFFDFEPQTTSSHVPTAVQNMNELDYTLMWDDPDRQLLSPPDSAIFSPKTWPNCEYVQGPLPTILTNIEPANSRTQFSQVTPTDDERSEPFRQVEQQLDQVKCPTTVGNKKRKRASIIRTEQPSTPVSKRSRKDINRLEPRKTPQAGPNSQEGTRRSKFLERNRVAASKCRQKKKQWVENLEAKARTLQAHYSHLNVVVESLKEEVLHLKVEMVRHRDCEGSEIQKFIRDEGDAFAEAVERVKQSDHEKHADSDGSSSSPSNVGTESDQPTKDVGSSAHSAQPSSSALPLDDLKLAEALLQHEFVQGSSDWAMSERVSPKAISVST
jgi:hypothetical protein